ncbi:MAG TPA: hypothetical protein VIJ93_06755 [bacterium]
MISTDMQGKTLALGATVYRSYFRNFMKTVKQEIKNDDQLSMDTWCAIISGPIVNCKLELAILYAAIGPGTSRKVLPLEDVLEQKILLALSRGYIVVVGYEQIWATKEENIITKTQAA